MNIAELRRPTSVVLFVLFLCFGLLTSASLPGLTLPSIFGDHMVLQRGKPVPIWGEARAGSRIQVEFAGQEMSATTNAEGQWRVDLAPMEASANPRPLSVRAAGAAESVTVEYGDVLVGEVWLCSGQSNMFWPVGKIATINLQITVSVRVLPFAAPRHADERADERRPYNSLS